MESQLASKTIRNAYYSKKCFQALFFFQPSTLLFYHSLILSFFFHILVRFRLLSFIRTSSDDEKAFDPFDLQTNMTQMY